MLQYIAMHHNILQCAIYRYSSSGVLYCIAAMYVATYVYVHTQYCIAQKVDGEEL